MEYGLLENGSRGSGTAAPRASSVTPTVLLGSMDRVRAVVSMKLVRDIQPTVGLPVSTSPCGIFTTLGPST
jgi:hypothetical protein